MMKEETCEAHLNLDGAYIDGFDLDIFLAPYLKSILIYGFSKRKYCYLDIRLNPFVVRLIGTKYKEHSYGYGYVEKELNIDLTEKLEPLYDKIKNIDGLVPHISLDVSYDPERSDGFDAYKATLVFEEFDDDKIDITDFSGELGSYFSRDVRSDIESDILRKFDPDRRYYDYHYF